MSKKRDWLLAARKELGYTQSQVAHSLDISRAFYTQIELGERTPSPSLALLLGAFLQIDWTHFYTRKP